MKRYYESINIALEGIGPDDVNAAFEMFQFYAARLLLGKKTDEIDDWLDERIAGYKPTKRLNIDLVEMTYLAALKELSGKSGAEAARKGLSFLKSSDDIDEEYYQIVESVLALAFLAGDSKLVERFSEAGVKLFRNEKTLTFELLFLALFNSADSDDLERLADIAARAITVSIWASPIYSAASHVCVLSAIAEKSGKSSRDLLKNRLKKLDEDIFEDGDSPRLKFGKLGYRLEDSDKDGAILTVHQKITGTGVLNAGAYELKEFTSELRETIETAAKEAKIRQAKTTRNRSVLLKRALESKTGEFRVVLDLAKDVKLPLVDKELLQKRFDLGWKIAQSFNDKLAGRHKLEISVPHSTEK
jgi:hypothetical protein